MTDIPPDIEGTGRRVVPPAVVLPVAGEDERLTQLAERARLNQRAARIATLAAAIAVGMALGFGVLAYVLSGVGTEAKQNELLDDVRRAGVQQVCVSKALANNAAASVAVILSPPGTPERVAAVSNLQQAASALDHIDRTCPSSARTVLPKDVTTTAPPPSTVAPDIRITEPTPTTVPLPPGR